MTTNPKFIMLVGVPASGKSTWRANYAKTHPGFVQLSSDDLLEEIAKIQGKTYSDVFADHYGSCISEMEKQFRAAIHNKQSIIWDQTNLTVKTRAKKTSQLPKEYFKMAVYFECSDDILEFRLGNRPGKNIPANVMTSMKSQYERPTCEEGFNIVEPGFIEWVK